MGGPVPGGGGPNRRCMELMDAELRRKERRIAELLTENSRLVEARRKAEEERDDLRQYMQPVYRTAAMSETHNLWMRTFLDYDKLTVTVTEEAWQDLVDGNKKMRATIKELRAKLAEKRYRCEATQPRTFKRNDLDIRYEVTKDNKVILDIEDFEFMKENCK